MPDIRKWKGLLGLALIFVLLSYFCSASSSAKLGLESAAAWNQTAEGRSSHDVEASHAMVLTSFEDRMPESAARISPVRLPIEEFVNREQDICSTQLARFLAIAIIIMFVVHVTYRTVIRRYGHHMIALWENIVYIHEVDGKKGERFSVYIVS